MAGPKAPIGTLSHHAQHSARLAHSESNAFPRLGKFSSQRERKPALSEEEDSESDSDSDEGDSSMANGNHTAFLSSIAARSSAPAVKREKSESPKIPAISIEGTGGFSPEKRAKIESKGAISDSEGETSSGSSGESSYESASEELSGSESDSGSKPKRNETATKNGTIKREKNARKGVKEESVKDSSSSSSGSDLIGSDSSSEGCEDEEEETGSKPAVRKTKVAEDISESESSSTESESGSESESESGSQSKSESGSEDEEEDKADESMALDSRKDIALRLVYTLSMTPSPPLLNPHANPLPSQSARAPEIVTDDFQLRKANNKNADASEVAQLFREAELEGKQVWYFTAPASIPIEVIEKLEVPVEKAQSGLSILSHNGNDYGVGFERVSTARTIKLLIPNASGDNYSMST